MQVGLQISSFTWPGDARSIGSTLARVVRDADEAGFDSIWVMDHFFQIGSVGRTEEPMLEGMTTLGFMAAHTRHARLGLLVGGVHYRPAGLWLKAVTTLDVLSGGRAWFGIGAAWNEEESRGLGFSMPPLGQRFEMLEETLCLVHQGWQGEHGSEAALAGRHVRAERILNSPQSISRPRPPILVGGGGERKTLRLVARYADACNVFGTDPVQLRHKFEVLERHCQEAGRDPGTIERTILVPAWLSADGARGSLAPEQLVERLARAAEAGAQHAILGLRGVEDPRAIELAGREVIPHLHGLGQPAGPLPDTPLEYLD